MPYGEMHKVAIPVTLPAVAGTSAGVKARIKAGTPLHVIGIGNAIATAGTATFTLEIQVDGVTKASLTVPADGNLNANLDVVVPPKSVLSLNVPSGVAGAATFTPILWVRNYFYSQQTAGDYGWEGLV